MKKILQLKHFRHLYLQFYTLLIHIQSAKKNGILLTSYYLDINVFWMVLLSTCFYGAFHFLTAFIPHWCFNLCPCCRAYMKISIKIHTVQIPISNSQTMTRQSMKENYITVESICLRICGCNMHCCHKKNLELKTMGGGKERDELVFLGLAD